ncbi:H-NS family nucleoid-associated regulatory protein [Caballeronia sp. Lep1P3]|uniref:H-NS family nucleoid-associated regulatory protein n=1 Tax=Caballeronia sp. Lep1P3 TaxID=2878150 RepID=UPI001FD0517A|nr:H-NS family nucleoid-associated regulatory protein [Caballeronia sp. Lep1P3]
MATIDTLNAKIAKLQAQAEALKKKQSVAVIAQIHQLMDDHGLSIGDLAGGNETGRRKSKADFSAGSGKAHKSAAKYRDPKTGAEWSGHGRAPGWIASAKNRDRFLIDKNAKSAAVTRKTGKAVGNYVRGPQPAKYRDPDSGATWSGRGKAPGWLASAKDRTAFLIDGFDASSEGKQPGAKQAKAKKTVARKRSTSEASA